MYQNGSTQVRTDAQATSTATGTGAARVGQTGQRTVAGAAVFAVTVAAVVSTVVVAMTAPVVTSVVAVAVAVAYAAVRVARGGPPADDGSDVDDAGPQGAMRPAD